ncbi:sulfite exporter TauE/SafE family protein [Aurantimonas endophytica]|uniref:Probable membrane transporter protein n=1 Tax=Aurantimonas endophytica TaxID=1522175 RepID=A0A7W6HH97_9HYPH|nr:sulfite exporter TauE/SafE family protein [Aurantimonas endophytica]MBB4005153.1 putative membrane protein YfcA [Aurantimonas endophytica]MCO6406184.1 TSUP family transporter [Aurantimonas endophytica]
MPFLPPELGAAGAAILVVASFCTSALTAAFGLGGGLSLLAVMTAFLPVAVLIPLHGIVQLASNGGRVVIQRRGVAWAALPPFLLGGAIGALIGARFVVALPEATLQVSIGLFILIVTFVPIPRLGVLGFGGFALTGAVTTFLSMFFGATAPIMAALFAQTFKERETVVATLAAVTAIQHALKAVAFFAMGVVLWPYAALLLAMIVTGFLGTLAGTAVLRRLDDRFFRLVLRIILAVLALDLVRRGVLGLL